MPPRRAWTAPEDEIVQDADKASRLGENSCSAKRALALQLNRSENAIYCRAKFLRLSPSQRDAYGQAKHEATKVSNKTPINKIKRKDHNDANNKIHNDARHDKAMTFKEALALQQGHNPSSKAWHAANTKALLSSPEAKVVMAIPGVGVHAYGYSEGGLNSENAGHATTRHRWVHDKTGNFITVTEYNARVLFTIVLGQWGDDVGWRRAERSATDVFLHHHPRCINKNHGGGGGGPSTCGAAIEFLSPDFFIDFREVC